MANRGLIAATAISMLVLAYPTSHAAAEKECPDGRTGAHCNACAAARADKQCGKDAKDCYYKFTVKKAKKGSLDVQYPESVFSVIPQAERDKAEEKKYEASIKDKIFTISVKEGTTVEEGATYAFKRCPDTLYSIVKKLKDGKDETRGE